MTARIPFDPLAPSPSAIAEAVQAMAGGASVLVRGDAGYAPLGRRAEASSAGEPTTPIYILAEKDALDTFVNRPPARALRIADAFWPGPLTLQFGPVDRPVRVRVSGVPGLRALSTAAAGLTVLCEPMAGHQVADPTVAAERWPEAALLLDSGISTSAVTPAILGIDPSGALRSFVDGNPSLPEIRARVPLEILCVCTGNTCRSPMAAALLARALAEALGVSVPALAENGFRVESAGLSAFSGSPASPGAAAAMRAAGLDLELHRATRADRERLSRADVILTMTADHLRRIHDVMGAGAAASAELLDPSGRDIEDPFGGDDRVYRRTAERLAAILRRRAAEFVGRA